MKTRVGVGCSNSQNWLCAVRILVWDGMRSPTFLSTPQGSQSCARGSLSVHPCAPWSRRWCGGGPSRRGSGVCGTGAGRGGHQLDEAAVRKALACLRARTVHKRQEIARPEMRRRQGAESHADPGGSFLLRVCGRAQRRVSLRGSRPTLLLAQSPLSVDSAVHRPQLKTPCSPHSCQSVRVSTQRTPGECQVLDGW